MKSCAVRIDRLQVWQIWKHLMTSYLVIMSLYESWRKGPCLGVVMTTPIDKKEGLKKIARKATEDEVAQYFSLKENEKHALDFCRQKVKEMGLPMKLLFANIFLVE